jgi:hypothetical protein
MFDANVARLIQKYRFKGLLLDTNLLLLLTVGRYSVQRIASFKRTASYEIEDYQTLSTLVSRFDRLITTPNILTEVDNLGRQLPMREHDGFAQALRTIVVRSLEVARPSVRLVDSVQFIRHGLTDALSFSLSGECLGSVEIHRELMTAAAR